MPSWRGGPWRVIASINRSHVLPTGWARFSEVHPVLSGQFQKKHAEVLEDVRKAKAAMADLQANVMVWLYDEIALRSGQEVDMHFDGTEQMAQQVEDDP